MTACPAAAYLRVSRPSQAASLERQREEVAAFARANDYEIVRTYEDSGRSGLTLVGRIGLQSLLSDIVAERADYAAVLVQDVSRWGRFQDPDEAAHYEFLCRSAGVAVRYCSEGFETSSAPISGLLKAVRRTEAASFSRDLSEKTRRAHRQWAATGHKMGGVPGYGLRRRLVGADGQPKGLLGLGEQKALQSEHVVLELGPDHEVATVRRIFSLYLDEGLKLHEIADRLNAEGVPGEGGRPWAAWTIGHLLGAEKYCAEYVFGRNPRDLGGRRRRAAPETLVHTRLPFEPIISRERFEAVRAKRRKRMLFLSEEEMLRRAATLLAADGDLTARSIDTATDLPSIQTYRGHFGPIRRLLARLGAEPPDPARYRAQVKSILPGYIDESRSGASEGERLERLTMPAAYTAFAGDHQIATGPLAEVATAVKSAHDAGTLNLVVFDDATGGVVDLDLRGGLDDVLARLPQPEVTEVPVRQGRGRPKLGVAAREVTLLPKHWAWLATQPGGASAALRKLVEQASRENAGLDAAREAQTAAYKVMYVLAGHLPRYEEALRAFYAPDPERFAAQIDGWPTDIASYARRLAGEAFQLTATRGDIG